MPRAACTAVQARRAVQKALVQRMSLSKTSTSGSPALRKTDTTKLRAAVSAVAVLKVRTSQTRLVRINMHLQEVVAGASHRKFEEVEDDEATPTEGVGKGGGKTCSGRWSALTR